MFGFLLEQNERDRQKSNLSSSNTKSNGQTIAASQVPFGAKLIFYMLVFSPTGLCISNISRFVIKVCRFWPFKKCLYFGRKMIFISTNILLPIKDVYIKDMCVNLSSISRFFVYFAAISVSYSWLLGIFCQLVSLSFSYTTGTFLT